MAFDRIRRDRKGKIVVLDTSAIFMLFEFSINLESELTRLVGKYKIVIPKPILDEITLLSEKGKEKKRQFAKPALKLIEGYEIVKTDNVESGDDSVICLAQKYDGIVVTNDRELRKRLKKANLKAIFLRGKNQLELD